MYQPIAAPTRVIITIKKTSGSGNLGKSVASPELIKSPNTLPNNANITDSLSPIIEKTSL